MTPGAWLVLADPDTRHTSMPDWLHGLRLQAGTCRPSLQASLPVAIGSSRPRVRAFPNRPQHWADRSIWGRIDILTIVSLLTHEHSVHSVSLLLHSIIAFISSTFLQSILKNICFFSLCRCFTVFVRFTPTIFYIFDAFCK